MGDIIFVPAGHMPAKIGFFITVAEENKYWGSPKSPSCMKRKVMPETFVIIMAHSTNLRQKQVIGFY